MLIHARSVTNSKPVCSISTSEFAKTRNQQIGTWAFSYSKGHVLVGQNVFKENGGQKNFHSRKKYGNVGNIPLLINDV